MSWGRLYKLNVHREGTYTYSRLGDKIKATQQYINDVIYITVFVVFSKRMHSSLVLHIQCIS